MRQLAPLAVVYLLTVALIVPASPFAADDVPATAPATQAAPPTETTPATTTARAEPAAAEPPAAEGAPAEPPPARPKARAAAPGSVIIKDFSFGPATITVNAGERVTWTNSGPSAHSASARDGSFDTGTFAKGGSRSHTFTKAGSFAYICTPHPFMRGTVRVLAASSGGGSGGSGESGAEDGGGSAAAPGSSSSGTAGSGAAGSGSAASGSSDSGRSLPKSGADSGALALLGALLLGLGAAVRRRQACS
jgi:LPXTG-motif cell wall-anchored protein